MKVTPYFWSNWTRTNSRGGDAIRYGIDFCYIEVYNYAHKRWVCRRRADILIISKKMIGRSNMKEMMRRPGGICVSVPSEIPDGTLFISVNGSFGKNIICRATGRRVSLENCARAFWREKNLITANYRNCEWAAALLYGVIVGFWRIDKNSWKRCNSIADLEACERDGNPNPERLYCEFLQDDEDVRTLRLKLVGKRVRIGRSFSPVNACFNS